MRIVMEERIKRLEERIEKLKKIYECAKSTRSMKAKCEKCTHCRLINEFGQVICDYLNSVEPNRYIDKPKFCPNFQSKKGVTRC